MELLCHKERDRAINSSHKIGRSERVEVGKSRTLARKKIEREHKVEKVSSTLREGVLQGEDGGQAKRASLGKERKCISW